MKKILVTASRYSDFCAPAKQLLEKSGFIIDENTLGRKYTSDELREIVGEYDAAIVGMDKWNQEVIEAAKKMKIIAKFGVGYDNIDVSAAKKKDIKVTHAKGQNAISVAELNLSLLLAVIKNIPTFNAHVKMGQWDRDLQYELTGKTIGLYGYGNIAQAFSKMLSGFDVKIIAYDKFLDKESVAENKVRFVSEDELLQKADVLSLHIPGFKENTHLIDRDQLLKMKKNAILLNTSRGNLINLKALKEALDEKIIYGAGLDCFEIEPVTESIPLFEHERVVCSPHCGGKTYEAYERISMSTAQNIIDVFNNRLPKNLL